MINRIAKGRGHVRIALCVAAALAESAHELRWVTSHRTTNFWYRRAVLHRAAIARVAAPNTGPVVADGAGGGAVIVRNAVVFAKRGSHALAEPDPTASTPTVLVGRAVFVCDAWAPSYLRRDAEPCLEVAARGRPEVRFAICIATADVRAALK